MISGIIAFNFERKAVLCQRCIVRALSLVLTQRCCLVVLGEHYKVQPCRARDFRMKLFPPCCKLSSKPKRVDIPQN